MRQFRREQVGLPSVLQQTLSGQKSHVSACQTLLTL